MPIIKLPKSAPKKAKQKATSMNIMELMQKGGRPKKQVIAIAMHSAGMENKKGKK